MNFIKEFTDYRRLIVFCGLMAFFIISGPYGTYNLPFNTRASYWISWVIVTLLPMILLFNILNHHPKFKNLNIWAKDLATLIFGIPIAAAAGTFIGHQFFPLFLVTFKNYLLEAQFQSPILIGFVAILHLTREKHIKKPTTINLNIANKTQTEQTVFLSRLPSHLGKNLVSISVSDHYLEIKTDKGVHLELLSLTKALEELIDYPGLQIHRSYWVAQTAIKKKLWQGSRLFIILTDGSQLPVSRSYHKNLMDFKP